MSLHSQDNMWRCPRHVSTVVCVHEPRCQPPDCSGHRTCVEGRCQCTGHFWQGVACNELDCGPTNCSQHGFCTESEWGLWGGSCDWGSQLSLPWPCPGPHLALLVLSWQLAAAVKLDGQGPTAVKVKATRPGASPPLATWGEGEHGSSLYLPPVCCSRLTVNHCVSVLQWPQQIPQTGWLKTAETYTVTAQEARTVKSRRLQGPYSFSKVYGSLLPAPSSSRWLQAFLGSWPRRSGLRLHLHMAFPRVCLSIPFHGPQIV